MFGYSTRVPPFPSGMRNSVTSFRRKSCIDTLPVGRPIALSAVTDDSADAWRARASTSRGECSSPIRTASSIVRVAATGGDCAATGSAATLAPARATTATPMI